MSSPRTNFEPIKKCFKEHGNSSVDASPVLNGIEADIFGPDMNKAARLAGVPRESVFVVSQEIMVALFGANEVKDNLAQNRWITISLPSESASVSVRAYPVPVVNVKGIEPHIDDNYISQAKTNFSIEAEKDIISISPYLTPWHVWEIEESTTGEDRANGHLPLRVQFKELQSLKIVAATFGRTYDEDVRAAYDAFENKLRKNPCKLFIDCVFKINSLHEPYEPNLFRIFSRDQRTWKDPYAKYVEKNKEDPLRHLYLMFSSVPDIKTNRMLRKYFAPTTDNWDFQHISYDLYEGTVFPGRTEMKSSDRFYLLLFQIRQTFSEDADDRNEFFSVGQRKLLPKYVSDQCTCIAYGLLRGEFDGFVLFSSKDDVSSELQTFIRSSINNPNNFFFKTAPIYLYDLQYIHVSEENIEHLRIAQRRYDSSV